MGFIDPDKQVICPDGIKRTFYPRGIQVTPRGYEYGYVHVKDEFGKRFTVVGMKINERFAPDKRSKNAYLLAPKPNVATYPLDKIGPPLPPSD